jgi:DNA invertase Pin-like site-specific DNA recombinase
MTPPCVVPTFRPYAAENLEFGGFYASSCESRVKLGRKPKLTEHQKREAIRRRDYDGEPLREIARSYNVSHSTISRLTA